MPSSPLEPAPASDTLLRDSQAGDGAALGTLLERHLPDLRAFVRIQCSPRLREMESCSDLVSSVCREVLAHPERFEFRSEAAFRSWLFGAALHKVRSKERYLLAGKRHPGQTRSVASEDELAQLRTSYGAFLSPSQAAIRNEEIERLEAAFDRLEEEDRLLLAMHRFVGLSHREIAEQRGKSETAVRKAIHRAMARLASLLTAC